LIRNGEIRLVGIEGEALGVVSSEEGLKQAQEAGLDLVEIAPQASPPVCRIMDFGKFLYEQTKKEKEAKKKQRNIDLKEIKVRSKIDVHDYETKLRNAVRFLSRGDKVKVSMMFRGREMAHTDIGLTLVKRLVADLEEHGVVERNTGLEGNSITVVIAPHKAKS